MRGCRRTEEMQFAGCCLISGTLLDNQLNLLHSGKMICPDGVDANERVDESCQMRGDDDDQLQLLEHLKYRNSKNYFSSTLEH